MNHHLRLLTGLLFMLFRFSLAQSVGGAVSGSTAFCTAQNSGFVSLTNYTGSILYWQSSVNNGLSWDHINNPTSTQSYNNVGQTTLYRALIKNGIFPVDTSATAQIVIHERAIGGAVQGGGTFCVNSGPGTLNLISYVGTIENWEYSTNNGNTWLNIQYTMPVMTYSNIMYTILCRAIVSNVPGCPFDTSAVAVIHVDDMTNAGWIFGADTLCYGTPIASLTIGGQVGSIMDWQNSKKNSNSWQSLNHTADSLMITDINDVYLYRVIVKNGSCPTLTTDPIALELYPINSANAGVDLTVDQYKPIKLNGAGNGTPYWYDDTRRMISTKFDPTIDPEQSSIYTLMIVDEHSCKAYDSVNVKVIIPVPNAITPNNDGVNDYFIVDKIQDHPNTIFQVFNKWGTLVYSASPYNNTFNGISTNGKELADEVYYYLLDLGNGEEPRKNFILIKR
jgi:gliding motility-associated-like protein